MASSTRTSLALLHEESAEQMRDGDKFFVAMMDAARACQAAEKAQEFGVQFHALLDLLTDWIERNRSQIKAAYLTIRDHDMLFVVMQKQPQFDPGLADSLTELDLQVANRGDLQLLDMEVMAIPVVSDQAAQAFLASGQVFTYAK